MTLPGGPKIKRGQYSFFRRSKACFREFDNFWQMK